MAAYFLDTSAAVKRYILEIGTTWVKALTDPASGHIIYVSRITEVEATAAIARRRRGGSLPPALAQTALSRLRQDFVLEYRIAEITIPLMQQASLLADTHALRAYDAVQLAAAREVHRMHQAAGFGPLTLVSADQELNAAAGASGIAVDDPNAHP